MPLSHDEVGLLLDDISALEVKLDLVYEGEHLAGHLLDVTKGQYEKIKINKENYLWHTFWMFVLKDEKTIVGSACFKGSPDMNGAVEIGYGTNAKHQNRGYTSEAVCSICQWALSQVGVENVIAETEKDNIPSQRVLEKCGFKIYEETDRGFWWSV